MTFELFVKDLKNVMLNNDLKGLIRLCVFNIKTHYLGNSGSCCELFDYIECLKKNIKLGYVKENKANNTSNKIANYLDLREKAYDYITPHLIVKNLICINKYLNDVSLELGKSVKRDLLYKGIKSIQKNKPVSNIETYINDRDFKNVVGILYALECMDKLKGLLNHNANIANEILKNLETNMEVKEFNVYIKKIHETIVDEVKFYNFTKAFRKAMVDNNAALMPLIKLGIFTNVLKDGSYELFVEFYNNMDMFKVLHVDTKKILANSLLNFHSNKSDIFCILKNNLRKINEEVVNLSVTRKLTI